MSRPELRPELLRWPPTKEDEEILKAAQFITAEPFAGYGSGMKILYEAPGCRRPMGGGWLFAASNDKSPSIRIRTHEDIRRWKLLIRELKANLPPPLPPTENIWELATVSSRRVRRFSQTLRRWTFRSLRRMAVYS